jgi:hypothetical protein
MRFRQKKILPHWAGFFTTNYNPMNIYEFIWKKSAQKLVVCKLMPYI